MKNLKIVGIGAIVIIAIIVIGVLYAGMPGFTVQDKTYSKNGMNFTYPGDMKENATFVYVKSPSSDVQVDTLGNDKLVMSIAYMPMNNSLFSSYLTFDQYKKLVYESFSNANDTKVTQLYVGDKSKNGTAIFEEIYTSKDPVKGTELKNKRIALFTDMSHIHTIIFQTKASDFESQQETINKIQNSIVLT